MAKPTTTAVATAQRQAAAPQAQLPVRSKFSELIGVFAQRYSIDPEAVAVTLKRTCFRTEKEATDEQMAALLIVANEYGLNPFTKEIYAFEDKHKGIVPIVSIDGWVRIINEHEQLASIDFEYGEHETDGPWVECIIERKDRTKPTRIREWLNECRRSTGPWDSHPRRMLRHKALIQCARVAFGFGGIYDQDEAERIVDVTGTGAPPQSTGRRGKPRTQAPRAIGGDAPTEAQQLADAEPALEGQVIEGEAPQAAESAQAGATEAVQLANAGQINLIRKKLDNAGIAENHFLAAFELGHFEDLPFAKVNEALEWIATANAP